MMASKYLIPIVEAQEEDFGMKKIKPPFQDFYDTGKVIGVDGVPRAKGLV